MKIPPALRYIFAFYIGLSTSVTFAHPVAVHRAITINAAASAYDAFGAYRDFVDVISSDLSYAGTNGAVNAMVLGSDFEDNSFPPTDEGGYRSMSHFYDPLDSTYGKGLSDFPPDIRELEAINSFAWGSISNSTGLPYGGYNPINQWSWQNARGYEWLGLTATNQSERQANLANMFRAVGQVMHLLEDCSQPQHVRNEQHLVFSPWQSPIEAYGKKHVDQLNYQHGMLDWRGAGFMKLEDFWDRHLYNGSGTVLYNAEHGGAQLGLAEWCNGNFLGARHLYPEYYQPGDIEYYPYPSRDTSTDYSQKVANLPSGVQTRTFRNGDQGQAIYLNKVGEE